MKLCKLIKELSTLYREVGDIQVRCWSVNNEQITNIREIELDVDEDYIEILLCGDTQ